MSEDLLQRAQAGDRVAFDALVRPHQAEIHVHCYRMLGSTQDAEDAVQETLLSAWLGLDGFEGRSSVRTWLYRIATNRCLNLLRSNKYRIGTGSDPARSVPRPTATSEVPWLQPYPDALLDGVPDDAPGPESRYESREAISLAFVRALQLLSPQQRAALLMRDVLGYRAAEAADLLGVTVDALNGALKRARAAMATPAASSPASSQGIEHELVDRFVAAFTRGDVEDLLALMTDDVWFRMPPLPFEYHGGGAARELLKSVSAHLRTIETLVPVGANRQPAWGEYLRDSATGSLHLVGVLVIGLRGGLVSEVTHFETAVAPYFGLPRTLG